MNDTTHASPTESLIPNYGVFDWSVHTKQAWLGRLFALWILAVVAIIFPWTGNDIVGDVMVWLGAAVGTAVVAYAGWRWAALRVRTGTDHLHETWLSSRSQTAVRVAAVVSMPLFVISLWTPHPFEIPQVWVLVSRLPLVAGMLFLLMAVLILLSKRQEEPSPAA